METVTTAWTSEAFALRIKHLRAHAILLYRDSAAFWGRMCDEAKARGDLDYALFAEGQRIESEVMAMREEQEGKP